jgi:hypothetical protein
MFNFRCGTRIAISLFLLLPIMSRSPFKALLKAERVRRGEETVRGLRCCLNSRKSGFPEGAQNRVYCYRSIYGVGKHNFFIGTKEPLSGKPDFLLYKENLSEGAIPNSASSVDTRRLLCIDAAIVGMRLFLFEWFENYFTVENYVNQHTTSPHEYQSTLINKLTM